jgi:MFS family permease
MQFLFAPFWGRLSDRIGRRPVLMVGLAGSVVFYTLFGLATVWKDLTLLFVTRIGAGIAGATISTAQAYIADTTTLEKRAKGMALIGAAFGVGFTFGPLLGLLAVPTGKGDPGPWPGYAAAGLSAVALGLAIFRLPESLHPESKPAARALFDLGGLRAAIATPSIGMLLLSLFVCVFGFANFESTLSLLVSGELHGSPFHFGFRDLMLTFAFIGLTLSLAQGFLVRRLADKVSEGMLAAAGAATEVVGFLLIAWAIHAASLGGLLAALVVIVVGQALMTPALHSLLSRRSDPSQQGGILGLGQSVNALARILGPAVSIPLLKLHVLLPYATAAVMMAGALALVVLAARGGRDYPAA